MGEQIITWCVALPIALLCYRSSPSGDGSLGVGSVVGCWYNITRVIGEAGRETLRRQIPAGNIVNAIIDGIQVCDLVLSGEGSRAVVPWIHFVNYWR